MDPILEAVLAGASGTAVVGSILLFVSYRALGRIVDARFLHLAESLRADTEIRLEQLRSELRLAEAEHMVRFSNAHAGVWTAARNLLASLSACTATFERVEQSDSRDRRQIAVTAAANYEARLHENRALLPPNLLILFERAHVAMYDWSLRFSPTLRVPRPPDSNDESIRSAGRFELSAIVRALHAALTESDKSIVSPLETSNLASPVSNILLNP